MPEILPEPDILLDPTPTPEIPLPKGWTSLTLQAVLHVIALARIIILNASNWPSDSECNGLRLRGENNRLRGEIDMLKLELTIKDTRFNRLPPKNVHIICQRSDSKSFLFGPCEAGLRNRSPNGFKLPYKQSPTE